MHRKSIPLLEVLIRIIFLQKTPYHSYLLPLVILAQAVHPVRDGKATGDAEGPAGAAAGQPDAPANAGARLGLMLRRTTSG